MVLYEFRIKVDRMLIAFIALTACAAVAGVVLYRATLELVLQMSNAVASNARAILELQDTKHR